MRTLGVLLLVLLQPVVIGGQNSAREPPAGAGPGLVVGSENLFSPIVASRDRTLAFYRDGVGLPSAMIAGIEFVEISGTPGRLLGRRVQDPGAFMVLVTVSDLDAAMQRMQALGGTVITRSGGPVTAGRTSKLRAVVVRDPDDHFVELLQPETLPAGAGPGAIDARLRLTVDDLDRAVALYRDALGFRQASISGFTNDRTGMDLLGLPQNGEYRYASLEVPGSKLSIELIEFRGMERQHVEGGIQDPGSTRLQLQVRDLDAAERAVVASGGAVVSTGAVPVEAPAAGGTRRAITVRDPNNLFLVFVARP